MFKKILLFTVLLISPVVCHAQCNNFNPKIEIEIIKDYGKLILDDTKSREDFWKTTGDAFVTHHDTMGLTVAIFNMSVESSGSQISESKNDYTCVFLDKIKLFLTYENIYVMIDKKYPKNSCQYKVIYDHEMKHVAVHKKSLDFYAPHIADALEKSAKKIGPRVVHKDENVNQALSDILDELLYDSKEILDFFEEERYNANAEIDTHENYEKERALCPKW